VSTVRGLGPWTVATSRIGHVRQRKTFEVLTHVISGLLPDGKEYALPFMVTGAVLVRLTEVSESDRSVDRRNDLAQPDVLWCACEGVTAADTALGLHETGAFQSEEDLLQVGLRESCSFGDVLDRGRARIVGVKCQRQQRSTGIVTSGGHSHAFIVRASIPNRGRRGRKNLRSRICSKLHVRDVETALMVNNDSMEAISREAPRWTMQGPEEK